MRILLFCALLSLPGLLTAQLNFHRSNEIPVLIDDSYLKQAWAGGINSSQWSTIDLNIDGVEDLFIYDRSSDQVQTYLKDPITGAYSLTFDFHEALPPLDFWVLMRDFNCDGQKDIFTYTSGGIKLYENTSVNGELQFELRSELIESFYEFETDSFFSNLYVSSQDIPSIDDFDGDGDLDIHTFTLSGLTIEYHKNMAVESGNCDSLAFRLKNRCYGMIGEDAVSPLIYIGQEYLDEDFCGFNVVDPKMQEDLAKNGGVHSGSSLCTFDYDGNGTRDLLIGDITARDMTLLFIDDRGPLIDSAFAMENGFPADDIPVDMHVFHAGYFEDLDHDGIRDVMITPSNGTESEDRASCLFYKNVGSNEDVDLELQSSAFLQSEMIDVGTVSFARPFDYNADGLIDLLLTNRGKYEDGGIYHVSFWLLENVGGPTYPIYELVTDDYAGLNSLGLGDNLVPAFGDLDNDGDTDMYIGDGTGKLHYFENSALPGAPPEFGTYVTLQNDDGQDWDLGASLYPQIFDLDNDGLLDLIVGERNGNTNFLKNVGSLVDHQFELIEDTIGDIVTDTQGLLIGYSCPWFYRHDNGQLDAFFGTESGTIFYIEDLDPDVSATWSITDSSAFDIYNGERSSPIVLDLDADGLPDVINGNHSGGYGLYMGGSTPSSLNEYSNANPLTLELYPNPTQGMMTVQVKDGLMERIVLRDLSGRLITAHHALHTSTYELDMNGYRLGIYLLEVTTEYGQRTERIIRY